MFARTDLTEGAGAIRIREKDTPSSARIRYIFLNKKQKSRHALSLKGKQGDYI